MALDNTKNFAKVTVSTGYDASATSIVLTTGHGTKLPTVPFNVTWYDAAYSDPSDDPNVEIVRVTAISTDTLTVTRAQESTSAATHNTSAHVYKMVAALTAKVVNTDLPNASNLASGTVPTARLGSGTADSTTFLRGDQTYATPAVTPAGSTYSDGTYGNFYPVQLNVSGVLGASGYSAGSGFAIHTGVEPGGRYYSHVLDILQNGPTHSGAHGFRFRAADDSVAGNIGLEFMFYYLGAYAGGINGAGFLDSSHVQTLYARVLYDSAGATMLTWTSTLDVADGKNISFATGTGTKIGTATSQKLSFWNKTPIIQPASANQAALTNSTGGSADLTLADVTASHDQTILNNNFTDLYTVVNEMRNVLVNTGLMKGAA